MSIAGVTIHSAAEVPAGTFQPLGDGGSKQSRVPPLMVPAFCRVVVTARPSPDSSIGIEVWLPHPSSWNRKFEGVGNGGYIGSISYGAMNNALNQGYATASTDTGHTGDDLAFGRGHPEKIIDWGYRAIHVTAETGKAIIRAYYGRFASFSYFNGCSTGGAQGLSEAQRFPQDYDGILAGDAGNDRVHLNVGFLWAYAATHKDGELILPESKLPLINKAALAACDKLDGLEDGVIVNPLTCHFDPATLLCREGDSTAACLTASQVEAVRKVYQGPVNPRTGKQIIAGWEPGSELLTSGDYSGWKSYLLSGHEPARLDFWKYFVFDDPDWDWRTFDYDRDVDYADDKMSVVNASRPNLKVFRDRGGKLLMYHGLVDPVGPPQDAIDYYEKVEQVMDGPNRTRDFFRLFLAPGMSHCNGGPGYLLAGGARAGNDPNSTPRPSALDPEHDMLTALDYWVQSGVAPAQIVAVRRMPDGQTRTIPVCAFPSSPKLVNPTHANEASGYVCSGPGLANAQPSKH